MNNKQTILVVVWIFVTTLFLLLALIYPDWTSELVGSFITANVAIIIAILVLGTNHDTDISNSPKDIFGEPPEYWKFRIGLRKIRGRLVFSAPLNDESEMLGIGPLSRHRMDQDYNYYVQDFAEYAGLYRIRK